MNILGIDTSTGCCSAALLKEGKLATDLAINHAKTHSVYLMPMIAKMLETCETDIKDIDYFACGVGPGSFTGVRIGVTTIKTFAQVENKPCVGVDSLEALCYSKRHFGGIVVAMVDARRERVFACAKKGAKILIPSGVMPVTQLAELLKEQNQPCLLVGDGAVAYVENLKNAGLNVILDGLTILRGSDVIGLALEKIETGQTSTYLTLEPNYAMKSKAEREQDGTAGTD